MKISGLTLKPADLLITPELYRRPTRRACLELELAAYHELSSLMAVSPVQAIQRFLDLALELCPVAGSAGLSELTEDELGAPVFKWTAMSGAFAPYVGGTTPRNFSPCGLCLDQHHSILVDRPARVFTYFNDAQPEIIEGLIVPLYNTGKRPIGTLWVTSHTPDRRFDATDSRIMEQLAVQLVLAIKLRRKTMLMVQLEENARDKEVLVHEVRHRVKNMIQMTSSLLQLQQRGLSSAEAKTALREAQGRLLVLASVYESLLSPGADSRQVDAAALVASLVHALKSSSPRGRDISIRMECEPLLLEVNSAVPLGLIVNEAVTNALKHGFDEDQAGEIAITMRKDGSCCSLAIVDDGRGFMEPVREGSLGMRLMKSLARQLGGQIEVDGSSGGKVALQWHASETAELQPAETASA